MKNLEKDLFIKLDFEDREIRKKFLYFLEKSIECLSEIEDVKENSKKEMEFLKNVEERISVLNDDFKFLQKILPLAKEKKKEEKEFKERPEKKEVKKKYEEKIEKVEKIKEKKTKKIKLQEELEEIRKKLASV